MSGGFRAGQMIVIILSLPAHSRRETSRVLEEVVCKPARARIPQVRGVLRNSADDWFVRLC